MKKLAILIVGFIVFVMTPPPCGADIHVSTTGSDSGTCGTISAPCKTIGQGVINAGSGTNVVKITAGSYSEYIKIDSSVTGLTIQGGWKEDFSRQSCNPDLTVLSPGAPNQSILILNAGALQSIKAALSCLTLKGANDAHLTGIDLIATHGLVNFNMNQVIIDGFAGQGMRLSSDSNGALTVTSDKSVFRNAHPPLSGSAQPGAGIQAVALGGSSQKIELENCLLYDNEAISGGAAIDSQTNGNGSTTHLKLTNVTLSNNRSLTGGIRVAAYDSGQMTMDIVNSIVWGNSKMDTAQDIFMFQASPGITMVNTRYSIVGEVLNSSGTYNDDGHNLNLDPLLTTSYRLGNRSPAIDAAQCGFNAIVYIRVAPYDDFDGDSRPGYGTLTGCDIGADEYQDDTFCFPVKTQNGRITVICL